MDNTVYLSILFDEGKMTEEELEFYLSFIKSQYKDYDIVVFDSLHTNSSFDKVLSKYFKNIRNYSNIEDMLTDLNDYMGVAFFLGFVMNETEKSYIMEDLQLAYTIIDHLRIRQIVLDYEEEEGDNKYD